MYRINDLCSFALGTVSKTNQIRHYRKNSNSFKEDLFSVLEKSSFPQRNQKTSLFKKVDTLFQTQTLITVILRKVAISYQIVSYGRILKKIQKQKVI